MPYFDFGCITAVDGNGGLVNIIADTGEIIPICEKFTDDELYDLVVLNDCAYILSSGYNDIYGRFANSVWRVGLKSGNAVRLDIENAEALYLSSGGTLYCCTDGGVYRYKSGGFEEIALLDINTSVQAFILENGWFIYADEYNGSRQLVKININTFEKGAFKNNQYIENIKYGGLRYDAGNIIYTDTSDDIGVSLKSVFISNEILPSNISESDKEADLKKLKFSGLYFSSPINIDTMKNASMLSGLNCEYINHGVDDIYLKVMAGDSDVDIYFIGISEAKKLIDKGACVPIESDIIKAFNDSCFDYIRDSTFDSEGNTVLMPIYSQSGGIIYPKSAAEELGFTPDDIKYFNDFISLVREYDGSRKSYCYGISLFHELNSQYQNFYCDFENGVANYDTEVYKELYHFLDGWVNYSSNPVVPGFASNADLSPNPWLTLLNSDKILFNLRSDYEMYANGMPDATYGPKPDFTFDINDWRAVHEPYLSEKVDKILGGAVCAYINPHSSKKAEAVRALEYIAEHYYDALDRLFEYPFIKKDINDYPERYHTESDLFNDFYNIAANSCVGISGPMSAREDIDEYQNGRLTIDEAIEMYEREVNIWLNE